MLFLVGMLLLYLFSSPWDIIVIVLCSQCTLDLLTYLPFQLLLIHSCSFISDLLVINSLGFCLSEKVYLIFFLRNIFSGYRILFGWLFLNIFKDNLLSSDFNYFWLLLRFYFVLWFSSIYYDIINMHVGFLAISCLFV